MAFASRRKMISNTLRVGLDSAQISAAMSAAGLCANARAQDLTLEEFVALARCIAEAKPTQQHVQKN
jgi:16S rRNA A1518/A1519 N6-dimethyltransferase RsmA/KsgA/DIM1 with predicted DNA glycosylase/AP lyase activity